jgi:hypothetical protein
LVLQVGEFLQRAEIIAKVEVSGRLDAGKNALWARIWGLLSHGSGV